MCTARWIRTQQLICYRLQLHCSSGKQSAELRRTATSAACAWTSAAHGCGYPTKPSTSPTSPRTATTSFRCINSGRTSVVCLRFLESSARLNLLKQR